MGFRVLGASLAQGAGKNSFQDTAFSSHERGCYRAAPWANCFRGLLVETEQSLSLATPFMCYIRGVCAGRRKPSPQSLHRHEFLIYLIQHPANFPHLFRGPVVLPSLPSFWKRSPSPRQLGSPEKEQSLHRFTQGALCEAQEGGPNIILPTIHLSQDSVSWVLLTTRPTDMQCLSKLRGRNESVSIWPALPWRAVLSLLPSPRRLSSLAWMLFSSLPLVYFSSWGIRTSTLRNLTQC